MLAVELPQLKHDVRGSGPDAFHQWGSCLGKWHLSRFIAV